MLDYNSMSDDYLSFPWLFTEPQDTPEADANDGDALYDPSADYADAYDDESEDD